MKTIEEIKAYLKNYDGPDMNIMEVCGSHTGAIAKYGIKGLLSPKIHLISGPGCPVCVTTSAYVDKIIEISLQPNTCVVTFGDLMRVPGSEKSLSMVKGEGARVEMVYSPMDILTLAEKEPETEFVFAAIGFETTTPVYALLVDAILSENRKNIKLLTALKTMPAVIDYLCAHDAPVQGFLAPGHVSVVTGSDIFVPLAEKYQLPFGVSGFEGEELLYALYGIVKAYGKGKVMNFYPSVVTAEGNKTAQAMVAKYFEPCSAAWRGMGRIPDSGLQLRPEYAFLDAGSDHLYEDQKKNKACQCDLVLMGKKKPTECPLFRKVCNPLTPQGACMVSEEGSCNTAIRYNEEN